MSTLLWVIAPLAVLGTFLLLRKLAGHTASRHRANVVLSLVLLAYFLATAGLGIFWVARQQLPVFELHYAFGYVVLLLVLVHVTLNGNVILRTFSQPYERRARRTVPQPRERSSPPQSVSSALPRWVACAFLLIAFGIGAFTVGTRCDRPSGPPVRSTASPVRSSNRADIVRRYHELSSESRTNAFTRAPVVAWTKPPAFKQYPENLARVDLPPPSPPGSARTLEAAVTSPPQQLEGAPSLDLPALSTILHLTCGVTLRRAGLALRAAPSSGALFSTEVYVAARKVEGLEAGVYHYDAEHHRLVRLSAEVPDSSQLGHPANPALENAPATVLVTTVFARTGYKYGHRAYRYILADAGHLLENLRLASSELGYGAKMLTSFDEHRVVETLSLHRDEGVLAVVPLVAGGTKDLSYSGTWAPSTSDASTQPFGPTGAIHEASSLRARLDAAPNADQVDLPAGDASSTTVWDAVQRRRSARIYADEPIPASELGALLSAAARPASIVSNHVNVWAIAHRVEGITAGAYRYDVHRHALSPVRVGDLTKATQSAVLSQEMAGQAAAVIVLTVDGRAVLEEGPRAYRHAWLEVGMLGERVYLTASSHDLGVCGAGAFFDDEAAALLNLVDDQWVAHFVAIGRK